MSWRSDYLAALQARDQREQANKSAFDAYAKLAARTAQLATSRSTHEQAQRDATAAKPPPSSSSSSSSSPSALPSRSPFKPLTTSPSPSPSAPAVTSLRADLAEAQTRRGELAAQLERANAELSQLRARQRQDETRIRELGHEKSVLATRLKDRDSELREKAKLLSDVQAENVTLDLELNEEIKRNDTLVAENKELVDRWMARMGREAERMNLESKFT